MTRFQVGIAGDPKPDDPWFHDERVAIEHANRWHQEKPFGKETIAIYNESGEYLYLLFDGEMFRRA